MVEAMFSDVRSVLQWSESVVGQELQPVVGLADGDLDDVGSDDVGGDEGVFGDALLEVFGGGVVGEYGATDTGFDASDQQEHLVVETLLDPLLMAGHVLRGLVLVGGEFELYYEHRLSRF
ncbi:hypothetical protein [Nocardia yamanashiensis]|uniref:hypothetical protein n=1 Tax=Nocardia yamanashiensis TaxID=209247 RepID=UPI0012FD57F8|nr:hypothetical protein [Nocardia yamanashiensis]